MPVAQKSLMADVVKMEDHDRDWVRFFKEPWECDWCGLMTRGRVYEETQAVVCSACHNPLIEIDGDPQHYLAFEEDFE